MPDQNPAGPAGGIPDALSSAFDKAMTDLDIDLDFTDEAPAEKPEPEPVEELAEADDGPEPDKPQGRQPQRTVRVEPRQGIRQVKPGEAKPAAAPAAEATPEDWDDARRAQFDKLTPEARAFALDLHNEHVAQARELQGYAQYGQNVRSLITDEHRQQMIKGGFKTEVDAMAHLIRLNDWAMHKFPDYVRWAVNQYGQGDLARAVRAIFPDVIGADGADPDYQPPREPDPFQQQVSETLGALRTDLEGLKSGAHQQRLRLADQAIASFRSATDAAGNPRYPYIRDVEKVVARLVVRPEYLAIEDMGERLAAAYDAAVAMSPRVRQKDRQAEVDRLMAAKTAAQDVDRARRARPLVNSPPPGSRPQATKGLDAALNRAFSEVLGN